MKALVIALDIGSSSVRCSAYEETGAYVESTRQVQAYQAHADGSLSLDTVVQACEGVMDACLDSLHTLRRRHQIAGVGISAMAMSWLGVDANGVPTTPVYTYANRHGAQEAIALRKTLQQQELEAMIHDRSGVPIHTAYAPAQLRGLYAADREWYQTVVWWQTLGAFLLARWMGQVPGPISTSDAGWTGLLDRYGCTWNIALLPFLPLTANHLPPVQDYSQGVTGLVNPWATRWPALRTVPFFLAVGDGAAANIGVGGVDHRTLVMTVGTTAAVRVVVSQADSRQAPAVPTGLWGYRIDQHRHLLGGAITDGGSIVRWIHDFFAGEWSELDRVAASTPPDGHGLTLLPFLHGERSPGWADNATVAIQGLTSHTHPGHVLRAGLEAVAFRLYLIARRLEDQLTPDAPILASGGALEISSLWRQIMADVFDREVRLTTASETTSRGAAILALEALGLTARIERQLPLASVTHPNPRHVPLYRQALARHEDLYARLY